MKFQTAGRIVFIGLALLGGIASPAAGQKEDPDVAAGWAAAMQLEYAKARASFEAAIKRDVLEGYRGLGALYLSRSNPERNPAEARRMFEMGAARKHPGSIIHLAQMLGSGEDVPQDMARARELLNSLIANRANDPDMADLAAGNLRELERKFALAQQAATPMTGEERWRRELEVDTRPGAEEFRAGLEAFAKDDFLKAAEAWKTATDKGYAAAFARLGRIFQFGHGRTVNEAWARRLYESGAAKNDPEAMLRLGEALAGGKGGPRDLPQAKQWYERAVAHPEILPDDRKSAQAALTDINRQLSPKTTAVAQAPKSPAVPASNPAPIARPAVAAAAPTAPGQAEFDQASARISAGQIKEAVALYEQAAAKGHPGAMMNLFEAYFLGLGVTRDHDKAVAWLKKAAAAGDAGAVAELKKINAGAQSGALEHQKGMDAYKAKKVKEAVAFWEKAAAAGHVPAMVELGLTLENGEEDVAANPAASFRWFERAAEKNDIEGLLGVGRAYFNGRAVKADPARAREYYEKARTVGAANPNAVAAAEAELAVLKGETPEHAFRLGFSHYQAGKFDEAMKWYRKASDGGVFGASFNIGMLYERGEGVPRDPAQALAWFEKSKAQGNTAADTAIKRMKPKLVGLDDLKKAEAAQQAKKYAEARAAYEKSAAAGNVDAMMKLAEIYRRGIAVIQNKRTAVSWYEKAAAAGDDFAANEADSLQREIQMWDQNLHMVQLAGAIDGVASPAAAVKSGPVVRFDSLIKNSPWTVEQLVAAVKSRADAEALAVAIRTDGVVDLYDGDYRRMKAIPDGTAFLEYGNLNMAFIENMKPGAGKWVQDLVDAAIAKRRAELSPAPLPVDSADLRARAKAGDAEALCVLNLLPQADLKLGALPPELSRSVNDLRELVRKANHRPGFWLLGDELEYNADKAKVDRAQAAEYFRMAAEAGSAQGADKLASAFHQELEGGLATNYLEVEAWLIEAAARARPGEFIPASDPANELYLLYSSAKPVGNGFAFLNKPSDLRWLRELVRRGGAVGEFAALTLDNMRQKPNQNIDGILKDLPPEVPSFAAAEVARLEAAAKADNIEAMLKLADALATGRGLRQHDKRAVDYYLQAAAQGSIPAMKKVAQHYASGYGVKKDPARQLEWTRRVAETSGAPEDWVTYGDRLSNTNDTSQTAAMLAAYEKAAAAKLPAAFDRLASAYQYGWNGVEKSRPKAIEVRLRAAANGDPKAPGRLALLYVEQNDHPNALLWAQKAWDGGEREMAIVLARELYEAKRTDEANAMYKEAGADGNEEGQYMYASAMEQVDPAEAYAWHKKLATNPRARTFKHRGEQYVREYDEEQNAPAGSEFAIRRQAKTGDTAAMLEYARRIAPRDRLEAFDFVRRAANKGDVNGMLMLANELAATDKAHAMEWVNKAVAAGSTQAMVVLANQLAATDMTKALEWLRKAEELGNADAKFQLGGMHYQGRGMAQDQAKGVELMLAAAEAGSLVAQFEIGRAQMQGMPGLAADQAKGIALLKKASDANVAQAAAVLGEIYERGVGTPQNLEEAHKYYRKAVSLGLTQFKAKADQLQSMLMKGMGPKK